MLIKQYEAIKNDIPNIPALFERDEADPEGIDAIGVCFNQAEEPILAIIPWSQLIMFRVLIDSLAMHGIALEHYLSQHSETCGCIDEVEAQRLTAALTRLMEKMGYAFDETDAIATRLN